jgi:hypothetical protein
MDGVQKAALCKRSLSIAWLVIKVAAVAALIWALWYQCTSWGRPLVLGLLVLSLSGCQLAQMAPSLRYCDSISYQRHGREIDINAHCFEAIEPAFPIAVPKP